jgi:hypothetical protein
VAGTELILLSGWKRVSFVEWLEITYFVDWLEMS